MAEVKVFNSVSELADEAAIMTVTALSNALELKSQVNWVLSGGTAPMQAYAAMAAKHKADVDWHKVCLLIGDERIVPRDSLVANWNQIAPVLMDNLPILKEQLLRPEFELSAEQAASKYNDVVNGLIEDNTNIPRLDHIWLGMGEDGHTLSLFPSQLGVITSESLVIPIHNSPKPPSDRISLTLKALGNVGTCLILAVGENKAEVVDKALNGDASLPITLAIQAIEAGGGKVTWLLDKAAAKH